MLVLVERRRGRSREMADADVFIFAFLFLGGRAAGKQTGRAYFRPPTCPIVYTKLGPGLALVRALQPNHTE